MSEKQYDLPYEEFASIDELSAEDAELLNAARKATGDAYARYSGFRVAAAARLQNGTILTGANQENSAYPAGICAERVLLSACSAIHPHEPIDAVALTYDSNGVTSDHPITPCGICRQSLIEYEDRGRQKIKMIFAGQTGPIIVLHSAYQLLPFAFNGKELG